MTTIIAQDNPLFSQPQSQTQHLANLLYEAALWLTPSHLTLSQPQIISPTMPTNAHVSVSKAPHQPKNSLYAPHSSQQEDQSCKVHVSTSLSN